MHRILVFVIFALVIAAAVVVASRAQSPEQGAEAVESSERGDVILVRCKRESRGFSITNFQGSAGTPTVRTESCAETLSDLVKRGFKIDDVGHNLDVDVTMYTLLR